MVDCSRLKNVDYRNLKVHYFLFNAGLASVLPYLPVHANEIGIPVISVRMIYCMVPFFTMILKPLFGCIADLFNILKSLMVVLLGVIMLSALSTVSIPQKLTVINSVIHCSPSGTELYFKSKPSANCMMDYISSGHLQCNMHCFECAPFAENIAESSSLEAICFQNDDLGAQLSTKFIKNKSSFSFSVQEINMSDWRMNTVCVENLNFTCRATCEPALQDCLMGREEPDYSSKQFFLFLVFASLCVSFSSVAATVSDAICFNELGENNGHLYGRQRLWGAIGWGLVFPIVSYLNDSLPVDSFPKGYQLGAILHIVILLCDLYVVSKLKTKNLKYSQTIFKDVAKLLCTFRVIVFMLAVFAVGAFTAVLWSLMYWDIGVLGGPKFISGFLPTVHCLIGELPYFFFAGTLISKLGHYDMLTLSFIAFGLRFFGYSYISIPGIVVLLEVFQGPSYGLFYATTVSFANNVALPGTEVTVQGLFGSVFELGLAVGNILGGMAMEQRDKAYLDYFSAGVVSYVCCFLHIFLSIGVRYFDSKKAKTNEQEEVVTPIEGRVSAI